MEMQINKDGSIGFHDYLGPYMLGQRYFIAAIIITGILLLFGLIRCRRSSASLSDRRSSVAIILSLDILSFGCYLYAFINIRDSLFHDWIHLVYPVVGWACVNGIVNGGLLWQLQNNSAKQNSSDERIIFLDTPGEEVDIPNEENIWPPPPNNPRST